jgi:spore coat polysaccharide biosynthesis protein SpsF
MSGEHFKTVAIIQARMGSSRLPGKVLAPIKGKPMLWYVLQRTKAARTVDDVVVATTTKAADGAVIEFCREHSIASFRGSENDVLDRYYRAALERQAQIVVRITSDCPLIDPEIIDKTVSAFLAQRPDYASNSLVRTYPRGLDTEVMSFEALSIAWKEARQAYQRAHVTPFLYENPQRFRLLSVTADEDYSAHRWTVDTQEDLDLVRAIYSRFADEHFSFDDILQLIEREPSLSEINEFVVQKALHEG